MKQSQKHNKSVVDKILNSMYKNYSADCVSRNIAKKILKDIYIKSIDKVLEGKKVRVKYVGDLTIYKKSIDPTVEFKSLEGVLHGYVYRVKFEGKTNNHRRFINLERHSSYIRKKAIENNLDFPLYDSKKYNWGAVRKNRNNY